MPERLYTKEQMRDVENERNAAQVRVKELEDYIRVCELTVERDALKTRVEELESEVGAWRSRFHEYHFLPTDERIQRRP